MWSGHACWQVRVKRAPLVFCVGKLAVKVCCKGYTGNMCADLPFVIDRPETNRSQPRNTMPTNLRHLASFMLYYRMTVDPATNTSPGRNNVTIYPDHSTSPFAIPIELHPGVTPADCMAVRTYAWSLSRAVYCKALCALPDHLAQHSVTRSQPRYQGVCHCASYHIT